MPAAKSPRGEREGDAAENLRGPLPNALPATARRRSPSTPEMQVGPDEGHDAWTVERVARRSSPPASIADPLSAPIATPVPDTGSRPIAGALDALVVPRPSGLPRELTRGGALDLVDRSRSSQAAPNLPGEMEDLFALGDFTGALVIAELILGGDPDDVEAGRCADNCRTRLVHLYTSKIGPLDRIPAAALNDADMRWLGLDHRAGFLLSRVDGVSTVEEILDVCGMPRLEAIKTLAELIERGAIALGRS